MIETRPLELTPELVTFLVQHTPWTFEAKADPNLTRYGAFWDGRLVAAMGWFDGPSYRFVDEWASEPTRFGKAGSAALVRLARQRRVVGHVALDNDPARKWVEKNSGRERAVLIDLPAVTHG